MNIAEGFLGQAVAPDYVQAIAQACDRIAPTWPLDQMIAVNPWWEMRGKSAADVSALLGALASVNCLMPKSYYAGLWMREIKPAHLSSALQLLGHQGTDINDLVSHLSTPDPVEHWKNVSDCLDEAQGSLHRMTWRDEITHQISQFCAYYFQKLEDQPGGRPFQKGLYMAWLENIQMDRGIEIVMNEAGLQHQINALPLERDSLITQALEELQVPVEQAAEYLHALLLDVNGWASMAAYFDRYQQTDVADTSPLLPQLLAVRLAWELVLWRHCHQTHASIVPKVVSWWQQQWQCLSELISQYKQSQSYTWIWHTAAELAFQADLGKQLRSPWPAPASATPALQAAFCIDVRSEPFRRALEEQNEGVQTLGFAGFFGLPIEYKELETALSEPRLPGLLKPQFQVSQSCSQGQSCSHQHARELNTTARRQAFGTAPVTTFNWVEGLGLGYALKLVRDTFFPKGNEDHDPARASGVQWQISQNGVALTAHDCAAVAARILRGMSLTKDFAPYVLLVGHGSTSRNNPQAAGLDCGACGGHAGHVNARVLAQLLNDPQVRVQLQEIGIHIPQQTRFIGALHDTTTDELEYFDAQLPMQLVQWITTASNVSRQRRAPSVGLAAGDDTKLQARFKHRSRDWSQLRPEWGLANNAAFIAAPRSRTRHLNLQGRSFLHEYDWHQDADFSVLELIMTAPMVVAHWINMQYYASVTDNVKYGSGNKILHNVVGGHLGVFEGNGGDLRIGLPMQSVHDGSNWRHHPLRLAVYIAAPALAITDVYKRHQAVKELVDNQWLYLYCLGDEPDQIQRLVGGAWQAE
jgi:hypothetical protein